MLPYWTFEGRQIMHIDDCPDSAIGFIYCITDPNGKCYWGRKILCNTTKTKISAREKKATGTRKQFKLVKKESDWRKYWGSCKDEKYLHMLATIGDGWKREIIEFCCTKKMLGYKEIWHQLANNVIEKDTWNGNVMGKIYRKDIVYCT